MKVATLLLVLLLVLPMLAVADTDLNSLRPGSPISDEGVWMELLNDVVTPPIADPFGPMFNSKPLVFGQTEIGRDPDVFSVACLPPQIPEPGTLILVGLGLFGLGTGYRRRR